MHFKILFASALVAASAAPFALAQQTGTTQTPGQKPAQTPPARPEQGMPAEKGGLKLQRSDRLIGLNLETTTGEKVGRIEELILKPTGEIAYVVVSGSGAAQGKLVPLPWTLVQFQPVMGDMGGGTDRVIVKIDQAKLESAPNFASGAWPADWKAITEADAHFGGAGGMGGKPTEAGMTRPTYFRASQVARGAAVVDGTGAPIGTIGDVIVDPVTGRVNFVAVSLTGAKTVAVPWEVIQASRKDDKDHFVIATPKEKLQGAPEFKSGDNMALTDPAYVTQVYTYYSVRPYWSGGASMPKSTPPKDTPPKDAPPKDTPPKDKPKDTPPQ